MEFDIRDARPEDATAELLYTSAAPYYDAYAGSRERALRMLEVVWPKPEHNASYDVCRVAVGAAGGVLGICAGFPLEAGERLASRFVALTIIRIPFWRWPGIFSHLRAAGRLAPQHPPRSFYVDALATAEAARRTGIARALLEDASRQAVRLSLEGVALDTGIMNGPARRLYENAGFEQGDVRHATDDKTRRAIGGPGFVSYFRPGAPRPAPPRPG